jgi:hypothetical protein
LTDVGAGACHTPYDLDVFVGVNRHGRLSHDQTLESGVVPEPCTSGPRDGVVQMGEAESHPAAPCAAWFDEPVLAEPVPDAAGVPMFPMHPVISAMIATTNSGPARLP